MAQLVASSLPGLLARRAGFSFLGLLLGISGRDIMVIVFIAVNTCTAITFKMLEERDVREEEVRTMILGVGAFEDIMAIVGLSFLPVIAEATLQTL